MPNNVRKNRETILTGWKAPRNVLNNKLRTFGKPRTMSVVQRACARMQNK